MKLVDRLELHSTDSEFSESRICKVGMCRNTTRGDKDYCLRHIEKNSYAKHLLLELANRQREDQRVRIKGSSVANIESITCQEILLDLRQNGQRTIERIVREINIDRSIIYNYSLALREAGKIQFYSSNKGHLTLRLIKQEALEEAVACA